MLAVQPVIIDKYVRGGRVRVVHRDVLSQGVRSLRTAEAGACAGVQRRFWEMHQILFQRQSEVRSAGTTEIESLLLSYAGDLPGLDQTSFASCLTDRRTVQSLKQRDSEQRQQGVRGQPVFDINGERLFGFQDIASLSAALNKALG